MFKKYLATVSCAVGLFAGGCGGSEEDEAFTGETDTTAQSIIWTCDPDDIWIRNWYTSFGGRWVGYDDCCHGVLSHYGDYGNYYTQQSTNVCVE